VSDTGLQEIPLDAPLDHEQPGGAAHADAAPPAVHVPELTTEQKQAILNYIPKAKDGADLDSYVSQLTNKGLGIPKAQDVIDAYHRGARQFSLHQIAAPVPAQPQAAPAEHPPEGMAEIPADAKVDYGTASGLSPDEIKARVEKLPPLMRPGLSDLGVSSMVAGLDNEGAAVAQAVGAMLLHPEESIRTHGQNIADAYHVGRTNALMMDDYVRLQHPDLAPVAEIGGALANPLGGEAKGVVGLAKLGLGYGVVSGFEQGNGTVQDRLKDAAESGVIGMVAAPAVGAVVKAPGAVKRLFEARPLNEVGAAAERQGLDLLPADVGGPVTRGLTAATVQTPLGAPSIIHGAQRLNDQAAGVVDRVANDMGAPLDAEGAGQAAVEGANKYIKLSSKLGGRMYDAAAAKAGDTSVDPVGARAVLDDQIARLEAVPGGGAGLAEAKALRASLEGKFSVQGVRDMRTEMFVAPELRGGPVEARQKGVVTAAAQDVVNSLRAAGKGDAADAFQAADKNWQQRLQTIDGIIQPIIGRKGEKSGEQVILALNAASKSNNARLAGFVRNLPDEEQGVVRASLLSPLGKDKDGNFALSRFATDWKAIGDTAKSALFAPEARAALNDLATVGDGAKAAQKYSNHSNTARGVIAERTFGSVATGATVGLGLATLGKALAVQGGAGLLLSSPRFARWLARAPATKVPIPQYVARLSKIAAAEPAVANVVHQFQARLSEAMTSTPLAAQQENDVGEPVPQE